MKMYEIQPTGELRTLFDIFYHSGGVIDYVLIGIDNTEPTEVALHDLHKDAAIFTVQTATARYLDDEEIPRIEPEKAEGTPVEPYTFFHISHDGEAERNAMIALLATSRTTIADKIRYIVKGPYVWKPGAEASWRLSPAKRKKLDELMERKRTYQLSYYHAFSDPPYLFKMHQTDAQQLFCAEHQTQQLVHNVEFHLENLSRASHLGFRNRLTTDGRDAARLFKMINHHLFGDDITVLSIYDWDGWGNNWADYFDQGQEWWGSFLWTVYNRQTRMLVGIAASTSD